MEKIPFTGFDCFFLALEKHDKYKGTSGNTCRYVFDFDGHIRANELQSLFEENKVIDFLCSIRYKKNSLFSTPYWFVDSRVKLTVNEIISDEYIPNQILNKKVSIEGDSLSFDLIQRSNGNTSFIFSWHHLLMDGYGAVLFLKQLFSNTEAKFEDLFSKEISTYSFNAFLKAAKAKFFIDKTSKGLLSGVTPKLISKKVQQRIKIILFSNDETQQVNKTSIAVGAIYGSTAFFLTCSARAVQTILGVRKEKVTNFWIPVPRDNRKKGGNGPILGNILSFLFYRLRKSDLNSIKGTVSVINKQMVDQIKMNIPMYYNHLMNFMKWLPLNVYYSLIKRRGTNSMAGFLFTVAPDHPNELMKFSDKNVVNAVNLPSNTYPPGLTFSYMNFNGCLQLMILYYEQVITEDEYKAVEQHLRKELLTGKEYNHEQI